MFGCDIFYTCFKRNMTVNGKLADIEENGDMAAIDVSAIGVSGCKMKQLIRNMNARGDAATMRVSDESLLTHVPAWCDMANGFPVHVRGWRDTPRRLPDRFIVATDNTDIRRGLIYPETIQSLRIFFQMIITSNEINLDVLIFRSAVSSTGNTIVNRVVGAAHVAFRSTLLPLELLQLRGPISIIDMTSMKTLITGTPARKAWTLNMRPAAIKLRDVPYNSKLIHLLQEIHHVLSIYCVGPPRSLHARYPPDALTPIVILYQFPGLTAQLVRHQLGQVNRASSIARQFVEYMMRIGDRWLIPQHVERAFGPPPPPPRLAMRRRRARRLPRHVYIGRA